MGFDCSSLVRCAFHRGTQRAITLPRTGGEQYRATRAQSVEVDDLQPGDLLFWGKVRIHHVTLYIGGGRMIAAPNPGAASPEPRFASTTTSLERPASSAAPSNVDSHF